MVTHFMVTHFTMLFIYYSSLFLLLFYMESGGTGMNAYPSVSPTEGTITTPD